MNKPKLEDLIENYDKFEREMDESMEKMDQIDEIIMKREKEMGEFCLPKEFESKITKQKKEKLLKRCDAIESDLVMRGFVVEVDKKTPIKVLSFYLQYVSLLTEGLKMPGAWVTSFGCNAWCEGCFQKEWCETKKEMDAEDFEESKAS